MQGYEVRNLPVWKNQAFQLSLWTVLVLIHVYHPYGLLGLKNFLIYFSLRCNDFWYKHWVYSISQVDDTWCFYIYTCRIVMQWKSTDKKQVALPVMSNDQEIKFGENSTKNIDYWNVTTSFFSFFFFSFFVVAVWGWGVERDFSLTIGRHQLGTSVLSSGVRG